MRTTGLERLEARLLAQVAAAEAYVRAGDRDGAVDVLFIAEEEIDGELEWLSGPAHGGAGMVRAGRTAFAVRDRAVDMAEREAGATAYNLVSGLSVGAEHLLELIGTGPACPSAAWFDRQRNAAMDLAAMALRAAMILDDEGEHAAIGQTHGTDGGSPLGAEAGVPVGVAMRGRMPVDPLELVDDLDDDEDEDAREFLRQAGAALGYESEALAAARRGEAEIGAFMRGL